MQEPHLPELPEVETTRRGIAPHIVGHRVLHVLIRNGQLRWPITDGLAAIVEGRTLRGVHRRGKYLIMIFDHGAALWHLGMSGSLRILSPHTTPARHDHVDWVFENQMTLRFNDPRRFGALLWTDGDYQQHVLLSHLGPEPLTDDFTGYYLHQNSRKRSQAVKAWLMDARVVVGVGNIYANEALFASGIHPLRPARKLTQPKCDLLASNIKIILTHAIERGGTTLRDFVGGDGKPGYFAQELNVYGRGSKACKNCNKPLTEKKLNQRSTVFCTLCQK